MSDDHAALVAAVAASPDDDTPRLVLADWFDDNGGEHGSRHAEFIRAQVAAAREDSPRRERQSWSGKKTKLSQMFDPIVWGDAEPPPATLFLCNKSGTGVVWHRGCIEAVSSPAASWLQIGHEVLRQHPVRFVHIQGQGVVIPQSPPIWAFNSVLDGSVVNIGRGPWEVRVPRADYDRAIMDEGIPLDWAADRMLWTRLFLESVFPGVRFVVTPFHPLRCYPSLSLTGITGGDLTAWPEPVGRPEWVVRRPEGAAVA